MCKNGQKKEKSTKRSWLICDVSYVPDLFSLTWLGKRYYAQRKQGTKNIYIGSKTNVESTSGVISK